MELLYWVIISLSVLCLLYFCLITVYAGSGTSFSEFWMIVGLFGIFISIVIRYMILHDIKLSRVLGSVLLLVILTGAFIFIIIEGILIKNSFRKTIKKVDYIIILGAQVKGTKISKTLLKRLNTAINYMHQYPATKVIVSGGMGEDEEISEAEAMKRYLVENGISSSLILMEDKSSNTFENILYSKKLLKGESSVAIITNGFHMFRSIHIARKQGLKDIKGISAPTDRLLSLNYYTREAVGVMKDLLMGNI